MRVECSRYHGHLRLVAFCEVFEVIVRMYKLLVKQKPSIGYQTFLRINVMGAMYGINLSLIFVQGITGWITKLEMENAIYCSLNRVKSILTRYLNTDVGEKFPENDVTDVHTGSFLG